MKKCKLCGQPLKKSGRTEHFNCRMFKRVSKKLVQGFDTNSQHFEQAVRAVDSNPDLLMKKI